MSVHRIYVEKKPEFAHTAQRLLEELNHTLGLSAISGIRQIHRYDVEGVEADIFTAARHGVFSEAPVDNVLEAWMPENEPHAFAVAYLPGQFDQRADSAEQCLRLLAPGSNPTVATAQVYVLKGDDITSEDIQAAQRWIINPVDSHSVSFNLPDSLRVASPTPQPVVRLSEFLDADTTQVSNIASELGLAMRVEDLVFCQTYFREQEQRAPSITEIKLLDTYWSDHCRHTTFLTRLESVEIADPEVREAWNLYLSLRDEVYGPDTSRPISLMDMALIGMKALKKRGILNNLEESEEINAASIRVTVETDEGPEPWLIMFKNETHNHPTEIEPFGGAATCLGGAIRDPLSGRAYVYQAMRITGSADPRTPIFQTRPGKLPQRQITRGAADGYSSYGNQIGLATGLIHEHYHPGYEAKRMEVGAVVAAAPEAWVRRESPTPGDIIVLIGGKTGRDGIGGATGSSKAHTETALDNAAEVQKGNPPTERLLQRLFRKPDVTGLIKKCNDFGAGGISVAIGELADGLIVHLDRVPKKYDGLDGTELAISESQERMAVVIAPEDWDAFRQAAELENLEAVHVADVTAEARLKMIWQGDTIVDISREFLDSNGVQQSARSRVVRSPLSEPTRASLDIAGLRASLSELNTCSQAGLIEQFDSTIGSGAVLHPLGGRYQATPEHTMAALVPALGKDTQTATLMTWGFDPYQSAADPFKGAYDAVLASFARVVASGGHPASLRISCQEYFEKLGNDPVKWGHPTAALLGALKAQIDFGAPSIGGKDSMSGTFEELTVPPTLISFAVGIAHASEVTSGTLQASDGILYCFLPKIDATPVEILDACRALNGAISNDTVQSARALCRRHVLTELSIMAMGNHAGVQLDRATDAIGPAGSFLVQTREPQPPLEHAGYIRIGTTSDSGILSWENQSIAVRDLVPDWTEPLEDTFPSQPHASLESASTPSFSVKGAATRSPTRCARPRVIIPAFFGTNCEWDSARAFRKAGANPEVFLFRNFNSSVLQQSIAALADEIDQSQIIMLPGGFSSGDEPEGSAKFIATAFRNDRVADAVRRLLHERDGLILGICNGFQALIKLGLVPHGDIVSYTADSPTLTYNTLGRHISRYASTRIASTCSPWLQETKLGATHQIALSHGEGRVIGDPAFLAQLGKDGQIATQYAGVDGEAAQAFPDNPNGSSLAIEGLLSPDGRVFGKMGHSERIGDAVGINIPGEKDQGIFRSGVRYFG